MVGVGLGDARRDGADTVSETSLTLMRALGIDVLQIEDELGQILDRIDVVMRRRADEATPGVEWRTRAMVASTLWPGSWPPSPGLAPWAILICRSSALTRYSAVTPNRPDATCLIAERIGIAVGQRA